MMKKFIFIHILIISLFYFCSAYALEKMTDQEMKNTTGQYALADFTIENNTTRIFLNAHIETFTEIDSMKLGYYSGGWDQDWTNLKIGTSENNLTMDGFIIKADFDNIEADEPNLRRVIIGSNRLHGPFQAQFNSFTGTYNPQLTGSLNSPEIYNRAQLNSGNLTTFNFDSSTQNQGFFLIMTPEGPTAGIHAVLGYNEANINNHFSPDNKWWDCQ